MTCWTMFNGHARLFPCSRSAKDKYKEFIMRNLSEKLFSLVLAVGMSSVVFSTAIV